MILESRSERVTLWPSVSRADKQSDLVGRVPPRRGDDACFLASLGCPPGASSGRPLGCGFQTSPSAAAGGPPGVRHGGACHRRYTYLGLLLGPDNKRRHRSCQGGLSLLRQEFVAGFQPVWPSRGVHLVERGELASSRSACRLLPRRLPRQKLSRVHPARHSATLAPTTNLGSARFRSGRPRRRGAFDLGK